MDVAPWHLRAAMHALSVGEVIACPTEAVWGLSCAASSQRGVMRLLELKQRDWRKGLILVASDFEQLLPYIELPSSNALKRATATWPGPATWVFPAPPELPLWLTGEHDTIAVRISAHPIIRALCGRWGGPLVSTSANPAGREPARSITEVRLYFKNAIDVLVPGALGGLAKPTTIRDVANGHILRR